MTEAKQETRGARNARLAQEAFARSRGLTKPAPIERAPSGIGIEYRCERGHVIYVRVTTANPDSGKYDGAECGACLTGMSSAPIGRLRRTGRIER